MLVELIVLFCFSFVPLIWFHSGYQLFGHDIGYHINFLSYIKTLLYSWNPQIIFGGDWGIQAPKALLVLNLPELILHVFVQNQRIVELISSCYWLVLPGITMWIFVKSLFPERRYWFLRMYASLFSMFNFFLLQGWLIFEKTKFSLFAAFPLMILLLYRMYVLKKDRVGNAILMGLLFFFLNGGGLIPLFGGILVALAMFIVFSIILTIQSKENVTKLIVSLIFTGIIVLGLSAYTIIPTAGETLKAFTSVVSGIGGSQNFLVWEHEISKNSSIVNLFRLEGIPDWYDNPGHPYANQFLLKRTLIFASFIPILSILLGMIVFGLRKELKKERRLLILFCWVLLIVGMLFAGGSHPPFGVLYEFAMMHVPGFVIFRSSFYKFAQLVWFPIIFLSGYYLYLFLSEFGRRQIVKTGLSVIILLGIVAYHYPYFSTTAFDFRTGFSTRLKVPEYTLQMAAEIQKRVSPYGRIILYPRSDMGYIGTPLDTYQWGYYSLDPMPRMITDRAIITNDLYQPLQLTENLQQALHDGDSKTFQSLATISGITHVLWRGDVKRSDAMNRDIPLSLMENRLSTMSALSKEVSVGPWTLYAVTGKVLPMVYMINAQKIQTVLFTQQDQTLYSVDISQNNSAPFTLVFNQQFDSGWRATAYTKTGISMILNKHFVVNGFANAWAVDQQDIQRITLEYMPQRYFYYGLAVSGVTLIGILGYLIYNRKKHRSL